MGQGYSITTLSAGSAGIDVPELSDLVYERSMGGGRFMKSIRARQQNGLVFVKLIMKPYPSMQLEPYVKAIIRRFLIVVIHLLKSRSNILIRGAQIACGRPECVGVSADSRDRYQWLSCPPVYP